VDVTVSEIGWTVIGAVAVATAAHGVTSIIRDRRPPETEATNTREKTGPTEEN
jgi:hypothetical protein